MVSKLGDMQESGGGLTSMGEPTGALGVNTQNGSKGVDVKYRSSTRVEIETWSVLLQQVIMLVRVRVVVF